MATAVAPIASPLLLPPVASPSYPVCREQLPAWFAHRPPLRVRFARTHAELEAVQRLRYRVFNLELGEGLAASRATGRDADAFDATSHHLMAIDETARVAVGTYRLATLESASRGAGFYAQGEFDLAGLPAGLAEQSVELGRACIARSHRGSRALALLFQGIAAYALHNRKRFLFGCVSLPASAEPSARAITRALRDVGHVDDALRAAPQRGFEIGAVHDRDGSAAASLAALPPLFRRYLALGARVAPEPAVDRAFGTVDWLVVLDLARLAQSPAVARILGA